MKDVLTDLIKYKMSKTITCGITAMIPDGERLLFISPFFHLSFFSCLIQSKLKANQLLELFCQESQTNKNIQNIGKISEKICMNCYITTTNIARQAFEKRLHKNTFCWHGEIGEAI